MKYRQWKKNYKKKYGANPPFELDKRKQRRYARKMARQINITLPTMMETLTKEIDGWMKSLKSALITMCESTKRSPKMEQLSVEDWKPDACPKNVTVEEYLATFPKIKLTRREYLQTIPLYHAALYLAETTQKVHSSQEWYLYLNEKVDQNGEVLSGEYDVSETN